MALTDSIETAKEEVDGTYRNASTNDAQAIVAAIAFAGLAIAEAIDRLTHAVQER